MTTQLDYPDFQTPGAHADTIYTKRVPAARNITLLSNGNSILLNGGGSMALFAGTFDQPAWELALTVLMQSGMGTVPFARVDCFWKDAATGFAMTERSAVFPAGNGSALASFATGPCRGNQLSVSITNLDPSVSQTYSYRFSASSQEVLDDDWRSEPGAGVGVNGFTGAGSAVAGGLIAFSSPSITVGTPVQRLLNMQSGKWRIIADNTPTASDCAFTLKDQAGSFQAAGSQYWSKTVTSGTSVSDDFYSPATPLLLTMTNKGASGTISPNFTAVRGRP